MPNLSVAITSVHYYKHVGLFVHCIALHETLTYTLASKQDTVHFCAIGLIAKELPWPDYTSSFEKQSYIIFILESVEAFPH